MLLMGTSTNEMAIFHSYFDITRGYILCEHEYQDLTVEVEASM